MSGRSQGLAIGTVTSTEDPEQRGRLQIHVPGVQGIGISEWALVANGKTADDGARVPAEPGDSVIVGFLGGDIGSPVVVGWHNNGPLAP